MARHLPDDPLDRLLRRSLGDGAAARGETCPDPDVLAAFTEGGLGRRERQPIERHASSCARCARILAVVAASDPGAADAAPAGLWSAWRAWRWAVPMATAVLVVGVWFSSTRPEIVSDRESPAVTLAQDAVAREMRAETAAPLQAPAAPPVADAPQIARESAPRAAATEAAAKSDEGVQATARLAQAETAPAAARAQAAAPLSESQAFSADASVQAPQGVATPAIAAASPAVPPLVLPSPDPNTLWRVRGGVVERSTDGGVQWLVEYTSPRVIAGGTAVSPDVAWFHGPGGFVLRRTAAGWGVAQPPADAEIVSIAADSDTAAVVTLSDGRMLRTTDAGVSWVRP